MARIDPRDRAGFRSSLDLRGIVAYVVWVLVIAAAYVLFAKVGFSFAFSVRQITAVWPPAGIALAAFVLGGKRLWPGVFLGAFIANAFSNEPLYTAAGIAVGNTLGPLLGAYLLGVFRFDRAFSHVRDVLVFVLCASVLAMTVTATNGVLQLLAAHVVTWPKAGSLWLLWWIGDAMGVLLVAPAILTWSNVLRTGIVQGEARLGEIAILIPAALASASIEFLARLPLAVPLYPFVVWAALRAGARVTTAAIVTTCAIAVWGTAHEHGPFIAGTLDQRLMVLVTFTSVLSITGLVLSALTSERRSALVQMKVAERRFQVLAETLPQIVWTADASGSIDWFNQRWQQFTGSKELTLDVTDWQQLIAAGQPFERELPLRAADGSSRWFLLRAEPMRDGGGRLVRWYGTHTDIDDQRRALDRSARIATTLQSAFLPASLPTHPLVQFDALYLTASQEILIGGDWYDVFVLGDDRIVVSIGDVTGHGLGAAVNAGRIRESILATAIDVHDPAQILRKVDRLVQFHDSTVATALVAIVDPKRLTMTYASAGHPSPIVAAPHSRAQLLPYGTLPLGVSRTSEYESHGAMLEPGGVVAFYTDGITEFQRDIDATERALREAIEAVVAAPVPHPANAIRRAVLGDASPIDDAVLLTLSIRPSR